MKRMSHQRLLHKLGFKKEAVLRGRRMNYRRGREIIDSLFCYAGRNEGKTGKALWGLNCCGKI